MRGWLYILLMVLAMFLWTLVNYLIVGDNPRHWDYGTPHYLGGTSGFTSPSPPLGQQSVEPQVPAPEAGEEHEGESDSS